MYEDMGTSVCGDRGASIELEANEVGADCRHRLEGVVIDGGALWERQGVQAMLMRRSLAERHEALQH